LQTKNALNLLFHAAAPHQKQIKGWDPNWT